MHRYPRREVALLADQATQSAPLGADHDGRRHGEVDCSVRRFGVAGESNRPDARVLQLIDRPRNVDDLCDLHVRNGAGGRFGHGATKCRRPAVLNDYSVDTGSVGSPENCADVLWILDAVEDHEQRRTAGTKNQLLDTVINGRVLDVGNDALMDAAFRQSMKEIRFDVLDAYAAICGERHQFLHAAAAAMADAQRGDAPGAERFEHRVDAVDDHCRLRTAAANSAARSRAEGIRLMPDSASPAPRSIAGTAMSSSMPSGSPVSARRIGWKSAFAFAPLACCTRF